ncbi:MAG: hypothetical protein ACYCSA_08170 [Thermoplasmataceae archaeon]|jgi:hypothetical protein
MEAKVSDLLKTHDLTLRQWAVDLFVKLSEMNSADIDLDFKGIDFMGRSFASEYIKRKKTFNTAIREINMNTQVKEILRLVSLDQIRGVSKEIKVDKKPISMIVP